MLTRLIVLLILRLSAIIIKLYTPEMKCQTSIKKESYNTTVKRQPN